MAEDPLEAALKLRSRVAASARGRGLRLADLLIRPGDPHQVRVALEVTDEFGKEPDPEAEAEVRELEEALKASAEEDRTERAVLGLAKILDDPDKGILG